MKAVNSEKGMALIIVLLITAFLVAVIVEIVYSVHRYAEMASLYTNGERSSLLASGGVVLTGSLLSAKLKADDSVLVLYPDEIERVIRDGDGELRISLSDEQGKVSLNSLVTSKGSINIEKYDIFARLVDTLELPRELPDTLVDWLDINDDPRDTFGAETKDYYGELPKPYRAKNALLDSVDELLLVKGFEPKAVKALKPFVTVYTDGIININTAPKEVIMALDKLITEDMAETIISMRKQNPLESAADLRMRPGFTTIAIGLQKKIMVSSSKFGLTSRANVMGAVREVEAVILQTKDVGPTILYWREH